MLSEQMDLINSVKYFLTCGGTPSYCNQMLVTRVKGGPELHRKPPPAEEIDFLIKFSKIGRAEARFHTVIEC